METGFINFYQHIPEHLNPVAFKLGFFSLDWYSLMYLVGFAVVYGLLSIRKRELILEENQKSKIKNQNDNSKLKNNSTAECIAYKFKDKNSTFDLLLCLFVGLLIGARLGYAIFYNLGFYLKNPLAIVSPFDSAGNLVGIYGMSYYGGLIGAILAGWIFAKNNKIYPVKSGEAGAKQFNRVNFWALADFVVPAIPAGYFFGRVGNFMNGELYGRPTEKIWGVYFPADPTGLLRHPSQLYEAFFEGLVLFLVLWLLRNRLRSNLRYHSGLLLTIYLFGYGFFRFFIEFFREPDPQIGLIFNFLTLGQIFSAAAVMLFLVIFVKMRKKSYN